MTALFILSVMMGILILHEMGHIIMAKILKLKIYRVGVLLKPYPHLFVGAEYSKNTIKRNLFYVAGTMHTMILFLLCILFGWAGAYHFITYAFIISLIIESNPFFSDFTTMITLSRLQDKPFTQDFFTKHYVIEWEKFQFTKNWYLYFVIWMLYIFLLSQLQKHLLHF